MIFLFCKSPLELCLEPFADRRSKRTWARAMRDAAQTGKRLFQREYRNLMKFHTHNLRFPHLKI